MTERRVYLDHAATSWPKPPGVLEACLEFQRDLAIAGQLLMDLCPHAPVA